MSRFLCVSRAALILFGIGLIPLDRAVAQQRAANKNGTSPKQTEPGDADDTSNRQPHEAPPGPQLLDRPKQDDEAYAWDRTRTWLSKRGLTLEIGYSADFFMNLHGGLNTSDANQYRGLLGIGLSLDTETIGWWEDGTFFVSMYENHGHDISERHVGDLQALNNADAPNRTRLYEFWYEHSFLDDALSVKFGKMDANSDFAAPDYGGEFINSSPGFSPTIPLVTWPDPGLGVVVHLEPSNGWYLSAGVYDAQSSGTRGGFETAFHGANDSLTLVEFGLRPTLDLPHQESLPGTWRVGGFYHSGAWDVYFNDLGGRRRPRSHRGNSGVYVVIDQLIFSEHPDDPEDPQGLGAFFQFGWTHSDYNEITQHYGGGLQYTGLLEGRDHDICGLGLHHISLSGELQSLENRHSETAVEVFYKYQVTQFISIKPDLQYIANPGGAGKDAIVAGVRLELAF